MPADKEFDEDDGTPREKKKKRKFTEWDCPVCDANNPYDDGLRGGDELDCSYCGLRFRVLLISDERFKLIPI